MAEAAQSADEKPQARAGQTLRQQCIALLGALKLERAGWEPDWKDLAEYIDPWSLRLQQTDRNRGNRKGQKIINSAATMAARTLGAGMTGGIASPARPWLRLTTPDPALAEYGPVRQWLQVTTERMLTVMLRSNLYQALPEVFGHEGVFGTGCMIVQEDSEELFRCHVQLPGSYALGLNSRGLVDVFVREFRWTVRQVVERFVKVDGGEYWDRVSTRVRNAWDTNRHEETVDIVHVIRPNPDHDPRYMNATRKRYQSVYLEIGGADDRYLRVSGYDTFPVLAARWLVNGDDTYGVGPGHVARGDAKALQLLERRKSQAIEKMVNPPLIGGTDLRDRKVSLLPGDITYEDVRDGKNGLRPIHEVNMRIDAASAEIREHEARIASAFYADLFLMLFMSDRRQMTATEVQERHDEKLLMLGPTLERQNQDLLNPLIDRVFFLMAENDLLPEIPEELRGVTLRVEFLGLLAQTQKMVATVGIERIAGFVSGLAQLDPGVLDKFDADQAVDEMAEAIGVSPAVIRSDDAVDEIRAQRQQAQAAAAQAQAAASTVQGAQALGSIDMSGDTALTRMLGAAQQQGEEVPA